jgi:hypothetical protein
LSKSKATKTIISKRVHLLAAVKENNPVDILHDFKKLPNKLLQQFKTMNRKGERTLKI